MTEETPQKKEINHEESSGFSIARVVLFVIPPAVIVVASFLVCTGIISTDWITKLGTQELVMVTGKVEYEGKPVTEGYIEFVPASGTGDTYMGGFNERGEYAIRDKFGKDGAFPGKYVVLVKATVQMGVGAPVPVVPPKYLDFDDSGLNAEVTSDPKKNQFNFILEGNAPKRPNPPAMNFGKGKGKGKSKGKQNNTEKKGTSDPESKSNDPLSESDKENNDEANDKNEQG